jgi:hypothetical protein
MLVVILAIDSRMPPFFLSPSILDVFETKTNGIRYSQPSQYSAAHYGKSPLYRRVPSSRRLLRLVVANESERRRAIILVSTWSAKGEGRVSRHQKAGDDGK